MTTINTIRKDAIDKLRSASINTPEFDTDLLLTHATNLSREQLRAHPERELTTDQIQEFQELIQKRADHIPVAYLTGHREFYGLDFLVTPAVLIPRPETEMLVEEGLQIIKKIKSIHCHPGISRSEISGTPPVVSNLKIADIGTGSGCIIIALAKTLSNHCHPGIFARQKYPGPPKLSATPSSRTLYATDISKEALKLARQNAQAHQVDINFLQGHLADPLPDKLDLVIANPPYLNQEEMRDLQAEVQEEPEQALFGGPDGLDLYRELFEQLKTKMNPHGHILLEHGYTQAEAITKLAQKPWSDCQTETIKDLAGHDRVTHIWNL